MRANWVYFLFLVKQYPSTFLADFVEQISTFVAACSQIQRIERKADSNHHNIQRDQRKFWIKSSIKEVFNRFQYNSISISLTGAQ